MKVAGSKLFLVWLAQRSVVTRGSLFLNSNAYLTSALAASSDFN